MSELTASLDTGPKQKQVALYLPSSCFVGAHKELSRQQVAQLKPEAVSFLLENDTLTSPDQLVIRYAVEPGGLWVSALDQQLLAQFDEFFTSLGAELISVLPDYLLLPLASDSDLSTPDPAHLDNSAEPANLGFHASMLLSTETQLVRYRELAGAALIDPELFVKRMKPRSIELIQTSDEDQVLARLRLLAPVEISGHALNLLSPLPQPASHRLNMKMQRSLSLPKYVKVLLILLGLVWLLWLITNLFNWSTYNRAAAVYQAAALEQFKAWYPEERPSADLIAQINSKVGGSAEATPLKLELDKVSGVLGGFNVSSFEYSAGRLELEILAEDQAELDRLIQRLATQGFTVTVSDTEQIEDQFRFRILVEQSQRGVSPP